MKKLLTGLLCGLMVLTVSTGCDNNADSNGGNNTKVDKINNEINYFEIEGKKIYLTKDLEQFVMQLKGLGCTLSAEYTNLTGQLEIDDINSKDNQFYSIESQGMGQIVSVECPGEKSYDTISMSLFLEMTEQADGTDQNLGLYVDRPIRTWGITSSNRNAIVGGDKISITLGDEPNTSDLKDIEKALGTDYETETDRHDRINSVIYENSNKEYNYDFTIKYPSNSGTSGQYITMAYIKEKGVY